MLVKSIIAGTVLSLMAGGVVYFGTDVDAAEVKDKVVTKTADLKADISDKIMAGGDNHPHDKKSSVDVPSVKTESGTVIEAKAPTVSYKSGNEEKRAEVTPNTEPQKKWLNQYLKKEIPKAEVENKAETVTTKTVVTEEVVTEDIEGSEDDNSVARTLLESMGLTPKGGSDSDTGSFVIEKELTEEQIETAEAEGFEKRVKETENIWVEDGTEKSDQKNTTRKILKDVIKKDRAILITEGPDGEARNIEVKVINDDSGKTTVETETIDMGDGKIIKIVKKTVASDMKNHDDGNDMRIKVFTTKDGKGGLEAKDLKTFKFEKDISATVNVVMAQAEKIKMPELRDRAYLDLVSYGLDHGDYEVASKALKKIDQVELRDTARNRIAVAHAKDGNAEDAFGILDDLEVDALRDVMRLQVIEAMIAPDELPKDMQ